MPFDLSQYQFKKNPSEQLRHVDGTPLVVNHMQEVVNGAVQHLFEELSRASNALAAQEQEIKALKNLLKKNGIPLPKAAQARPRTRG